MNRSIMPINNNAKPTPSLMQNPKSFDYAKDYKLPAVTQTVNEGVASPLASPSTVKSYGGDNTVDAVEATTGDYNAVTQQVNPDSLVKNQLNSIIDPSSPLMQRAKTRALQQQNARGTLNSSMATGAAEAAMIDAAMPIAQQDAQTHFQQQSANQQVENKAAFDNNATDNNTRLFNVENKNKALMFNSELQSQQDKFDVNELNQADRFDAERQDTMSQFNAGEQNKQNLVVLEAEVDVALKNINQEYSAQLEVIRNEYQMIHNMDTVQGSIYQQLIAGISDITRSQDFTQEEAQIRIDSLIATSNASLSFSNGFGIDSSDEQRQVDVRTADNLANPKPPEATPDPYERDWSQEA